MPPSPTSAATSAAVPFPIVEEEEVETKTLPFSSDILKCAKLKYDGSNYDMWAHSIDSAPSLWNLKHLVESDTEPAPLKAGASAEDTKAYQQKYEMWQRQNKNAYVQISQCLEPDLVPLIWSTKSAYHAWILIRNKYAGKGAQGRAFLLKKIWHAEFDESKDMLMQINEVIGYAWQLESIRPISDEDLAQVIIIALPPSYETLVMVLTSNKSTTNLSSFNVISAVIEHESRNKETAEKALRVQARAAQTSVQDTSKGLNKPKKVCTNPKCPRKNGHTIEMCWAEGGGDEGGRDKKKKKKKKKASARTTEEDKSDAKSSMNAAFMAYSLVDALTAEVESSGSARMLWIMDSGTSSHMTAHQSLFRSYQKLTVPIDIQIANHTLIKAVGMGSIPIIVDINGRSANLMLLCVLHVPKLSCNLLSIPALVKNGFEAKMDKSSVSVSNSKSGVVYACAVASGSLFLLRSIAKMAQRACISVVADTLEEGDLTTYAFVTQRVWTSRASLEVWYFTDYCF